MLRHPKPQTASCKFRAEGEAAKCRAAHCKNGSLISHLSYGQEAEKPAKVKPKAIAKAQTLIGLTLLECSSCPNSRCMYVFEAGARTFIGSGGSSTN